MEHQLYGNEMLIWKRLVFIPAAAYAMIFLFGSILITIEVPQLFPVKFHLNTQEVGLQFLALIIGSVLGEQVGGLMSDRWMARRKRVTQNNAEPEFRLWLSYPGMLLTICGIVVFLVQIGNLKTYNVTPMVGAAIAAGGNQIVYVSLPHGSCTWKNIGYELKSTTKGAVRMYEAAVNLQSLVRPVRTLDLAVT